MPRYSVSHRTTYRYSAPVIQSHHLLHLSPRPVSHQTVERHAIMVEPAPKSRRERIDYFGNPAVHLVVETDHRELNVTSRTIVDVTPIDTMDLAESAPWDAIAERRLAPGNLADRAVLDFACASQHASPTAATYAFAQELAEPGMPVLVLADKLMKRIYDEFSFDNAQTDVSTPVDRVLELKAGVCQDFAHLQISALRALGLPARYVSGYIRTVPPEGEEKLAGADASHAWVSVWSPESGWVDFDPTNDLINSPDHVTIAHGRDFQDVSPVTGILLGGGGHSVDVAVDMRILDDKTNKPVVD